MGKFEQSHRDDWALGRHLAESFYEGNAARYHNEAEVREHLTEARKYNGWTNYETWSVNLILSNEQGLDEACRELVKEAMDEEADESLKRVRAADAIKDWVEDWLSPVISPVETPTDAHMLASQLLSASLSEVDWLEVAEAFAPEEVTV